MWEEQRTSEREKQKKLTKWQRENDSIQIVDGNGKNNNNSNSKWQRRWLWGQQAYIRLNKLHQNERAWVKAEFFRYN